MSDREIALVGFLDDETVPDSHGTIARFRIVAAATDERVDEAVLPCSVTDPVLARAVLQLQCGDQLRVTGFFRFPEVPDGPMWLQVHQIEVLAISPLQDPAVDDGKVLTLVPPAGDFGNGEVLRRHGGRARRGTRRVR